MSPPEQDLSVIKSAALSTVRIAAKPRPDLQKNGSQPIEVYLHQGIKGQPTYLQLGGCMWDICSLEIELLCYKALAIAEMSNEPHPSLLVAEHLGTYAHMCYTHPEAHVLLVSPISTSIYYQGNLRLVTYPVIGFRLGTNDLKGFLCVD